MEGKEGCELETYIFGTTGLAPHDGEGGHRFSGNVHDSIGQFFTNSVLCKRGN
jgi:hypothetical protein